jgi:hypothetical protein
MLDGTAFQRLPEGNGSVSRSALYLLASASWRRPRFVVKTRVLGQSGL